MTKLRRGIAIATASLVAATGLFVVPTAAHADTGVVGAIGDIAVTQTGSNPLPPMDPSLDDDIVASGDIVKWSASYQVATAGTYTVTATLPEGGRFSPVTVSLGEEGSGISEDGRTATLVQTADTPSTASWNLEAMVSGGNGAEVRLKVSGDGHTNESKVTRVKAEPAFNIDAQGWGFTPAPLDGVPGVRLTYNYGVFAPLDPLYGTRGLEVLRADESFAFDIDLSAFPDGVKVMAQDSDQRSTSRFPNSRGAAPNSVSESGTQKITVDGKKARVSVKGTDSSAQHVPTRNTLGTLLPADRAYVATKAIDLWIPAAEIPAENIRFPLQFSGLQVNSISGAQNAITTPATPKPIVDVDNVPGGGHGVALYIYKLGGSSLPGWTGGTRGPLYPGQPFMAYMTFGNASPTGVPRHNMHGSIVLNEGEQPLAPLATRGPTKLKTVEYGTISYANDDERHATQGVPGDGASGWFDSFEEAQSAGKVTAVRFAFDGVMEVGDPQPIVTWDIRLDEDVAPAGKEIGFIARQYSDGLPIPEQGRFRSGVLRESQLRVELSGGNKANIEPASSVELTVSPSVQNEWVPGADLTAKNVALQVTLPPFVTYQGGSASVDPTGSQTDANGVTTLTWSIPELSSKKAMPITFKVIANPGVTLPTTVDLSAKIDAEGNAEPASLKQAKDQFYINAPSTFGYSQSQSSQQVEPGDSLSYTLAGFNTLATPAGKFTVVDVLPYDGDANGTKSVKVQLDSVKPTSGLSVWVTKDAAATVYSKSQADVDDASINWVPYTDGMADLDQMTAVKVQKGELKANESESAVVTVTAASIPGVAKPVIVNSLTAVQATNVGGGAIAKNASPQTAEMFQSSLTGVAYQDMDFDGKFDAAKDKVLSGSVATLSGYSYGQDGIDGGGKGDDVPVPAGVTATAGADGKFTFPGLHSGNYTVTVPTPAKMLSNGDVIKETALKVDTDLVTETNVGFFDEAALPKAIADKATVKDVVATQLDVVKAGAAGLEADKGVNIKLDPKHTPVVAAAADAKAAYTGGKLEVTPTVKWADGEKTRDVKVKYQIVGVYGKTSAADATVTVQRAPVETGETKLAPVAQVGAKSTTTVAPKPLNTATFKSVVVKTQPAGGPKVSIDNNKIVFSSEGAAAKDYSFVVTLEDNLGQKTDVTYTTSVQAPPTATAANSIASEKGTVSYNAKPQTTGTIESARVVSSSADVAFAANKDGNVSFDAKDQTSGTFTGTVTFTDNLGQESEPVKYTVTIQSRPIAADMSATIGVGQTHEFVTNASGFKMTAAVSKQATAGTATVTTDGAKATYVAPAEAGVYPFEVTYTDDRGQTATATYTVTVEAAPVVAGGTSLTLGEDSTGDFDAQVTSEAGLASAKHSALPEGVTVDIDDTTGVVTAHTGDAAAGTSTFTVTYTDKNGVSTEVEYTLTIQAKPVINDGKPAKMTVPQNGEVQFEENIATEGTIVDREITAEPAKGEARLASVHYDAKGAAAGTYEFTVTYTDDLGQKVDAVYAPTVQAAPVGEGKTVTVDYGTTEVVLDPIGDTEGDNLQAVTDADISMVSAGSAAVSGELVSFTPPKDQAGESTLRVTVRDDLGQSVDLDYTIVVKEKVAAGDSGSGLLGGLASTGGSIATMSILAAALLALGVTLMLRRRKEQQS